MNSFFAKMNELIRKCIAQAAAIAFDNDVCI
jgi:hypothetical protein